MYNTLVERCFRDCVDSFRRKDLDNAEEKVSLFNNVLEASLSFFFVCVWGGGHNSAELTVSFLLSKYPSVSNHVAKSL